MKQAFPSDSLNIKYIQETSLLHRVQVFVFFLVFHKGVTQRGFLEGQVETRDYQSTNRSRRDLFFFFLIIALLLNKYIKRRGFNAFIRAVANFWKVHTGVCPAPYLRVLPPLAFHPINMKNNQRFYA